MQRKHVLFSERMEYLKKVKVEQTYRRNILMDVR